MRIEDVRVYKIAVELEKKLFEIIEGISIGWSIDQVDQIKRSSSSISANIIEGFSRRFYKKDYIRFLYIAMGSSDETKHHLMVLFNKKCIDKNTYDDYARNYKNLSIKILNLINFLREQLNQQ